MRFIDYDVALSFPLANGEYDKENANEDFILGCESYKEWLEIQPVVQDVVPVIHAEWLRYEYFSILKKDNTIMYQCSNCHCFRPSKHNFCSECGADMRYKGKKKNMIKVRDKK